jgi:hypothetical protein
MLTTLSDIKCYEPVFVPYENESGHLSFAIRSFSQYNSKFILSVDPYSLDVTIKNSSIMFKKLGTFDDGRIKNSAYFKAIKKFSSPPYKLKNYGMTSLENVNCKNDVALTIDLCPSQKPLDKKLFNKTITKFKGKYIPIAIAISGKWIENHKLDFQWLKKISKNKLVDIIWVNHSYNHPYKKGVADSQNFLLTSGVNFEEEIINTELQLIKNGITPSVFFRFPGLVADEKSIKKLAEFSLIPLGADAWLAIGQKPKTGSIILVHGNGNEPQGLSLLYDYYSKDSLKLVSIKHYEARTE